MIQSVSKEKGGYGFFAGLHFAGKDPADHYSNGPIGWLAGMINIEALLNQSLFQQFSLGGFPTTVNPLKSNKSAFFNAHDPIIINFRSGPK